MMPKISIIVPVYNVGNYLSRCLDSVLAQKHENWECILVDDGSTDRSGLICDEYSARDSRFIPFHKPNGGVSSARNFGITKARGEWIAFVDSDDTLLPGYLENLLNGTKNGAEIVLSNYGGRQTKKYIMEFQYVEGNEMKEYFLENKIFALSAPYGKLYKRNIMGEHSLLFPEGIHMGEDMIFLVRYMNCVNNATLIPADEYVVSSHEGSLSTKYYSFDSEYRCFCLWRTEIEKFINKSNLHRRDILHSVWNHRTSRAFVRSCECMYLGNRKYTVKEIIRNLQSIDKVYSKEFGKYSNCKGIKSKLIRFLIGNRLFVIYHVIALTFSLKIKYS